MSAFNTKRVREIMDETGLSFYGACRELGRRGARRAAFLREECKQVLARTSDDRRRQVARGLLECDAVPDEVMTPQDRIGIRLESTRQLRQGTSFDGRPARSTGDTGLKRAETTVPHPRPFPSRFKSGPIPPSEAAR